MDINLTINELIRYAKVNFDIADDDLIYFRNIILGELEIPSFKEVCVNISKIDSFKNPDYFTEILTNYLNETKTLSENEIDRKITKIYGFLTPRPSSVIAKFNSIFKNKSDKEALDYLYDLSIKNDYVKKSKIDKNLLWTSNYPNKNIEVSINLSKPEKNNKDIAKLLVKPKASDVKYPSCLLCKENLGYYGRDDHPARENIRTIPLKLDDENWYIQYSPYGYFNMHCIVFKDIHSNMVINESTFKKLLTFVDEFPYFFIGSNADLPIVGGSILNHEHYQGGEHRLPIMHAKPKKEYQLSNHDSKLYLLDWYNSTLLIQGKNKEDIVDIATKILTKWRNYDDLENDILSFSDGVAHSTVTPCVKKDGDIYSLYLILRNNRCNEEYPDGIFHAHPEYHHIKHEGIGIIEAMGLFILPARLVRQTNQIKDCLKNSLSDEEIVSKYPDFDKLFLNMIHELAKNYNESTIDDDIKDYINNVCRNILMNTAVFKDNDKGNEGIDRFINSIEF